MIPNQWYVVLESHEVRPGKPVGVTRLGEKMVFWRDASGKVIAQSDLCPHRGAALSAGKVKGDCILCPFHAFEFDRSGRCTVIPANGRTAPVPKAFNVKTYPTYEQHGFVYIYWGDPAGAAGADIGKPGWLTGIDDSFSYSTIVEPWDTHYSRLIENQLDIPHVPFVHATTIGRGSGPVIDGPWVEWTGEDRLKVDYSSSYRQEDGSRGRRADEMAAPKQGKLYLELIFPNLWQNRLGDKLSEVAAFVPIDAEHTLLYARQYQKFVTAPGLRWVVDQLFIPFNKIVLHQDRRVVTGQLPKVTSLKMGEKLVPSDGPIIEYRRHRQKLIDAMEC